MPLLFSFTAHFPYLYRNPNQSEQWKQLTAICRGPFELNGVSYVFTGNVVSTGLHHGIVAKLDERGGQGTIQCSLEQLKEMRVPRARASSAILPLNTGNQGGSTNRPAGHGAASGGNKSSSSSSSSSRNGGGTAKTSPARPATRTSQRSINALRSSNGSEDRGDEEEDRPGGGGGGRGEGDGPHGSGKKKKKTLSKAKRIRDDEDAGDNSDDDDDEPTTKKSRPNYGLGVPRSDPLKTPSPKKQPPSAVAQQRRSSVGRGGKDSQVAPNSSSFFFAAPTDRSRRYHRARLERDSKTLGAPAMSHLGPEAAEQTAASNLATAARESECRAVNISLLEVANAKPTVAVLAAMSQAARSEARARVANAKPTVAVLAAMSQAARSRVRAQVANALLTVVAGAAMSRAARQ